jgi:hypothetical protein
MNFKTLTYAAGVLVTVELSLISLSVSSRASLHAYRAVQSSGLHITQTLSDMKPSQLWCAQLRRLPIAPMRGSMILSAW